MAEQRWPDVLLVARHGESAGNVARDFAEAHHRDVIDIATRDMDVGLSSRGEDQAAALGARLAALDRAAKPDVVLCSPYVRAQETARIALENAGLGALDILIDERLREREFGILDRLTRAGIEDRFPEQAAARAFLGKFYHRPPGGESWCDVALRLRTVLDTLSRDHRGSRVLVVSHQVVILMLRYLVEHLTEAEILGIDAQVDVANCSLTEYRFDSSAGPRGDMVLEFFNEVTHLERLGAAVTREPDVPRGPR